MSSPKLMYVFSPPHLYKASVLMSWVRLAGAEVTARHRIAQREARASADLVRAASVQKVTRVVKCGSRGDVSGEVRPEQVAVELQPVPGAP